jgi:hypothetical protein
MTRHQSNAAALTLALATLSGCAGAEMEQASQDKLRQATIEAIEGIDPTLIAISDITRTPAKISWRVTSGSRTYACDADGFYRLPWCRPDA